MLNVCSWKYVLCLEDTLVRGHYWRYYVQYSSGRCEGQQTNNMGIKYGYRSQNKQKEQITKHQAFLIIPAEICFCFHSNRIFVRNPAIELEFFCKCRTVNFGFHKVISGGILFALNVKRWPKCIRAVAGFSSSMHTWMDFVYTIIFIGYLRTINAVITAHQDILWVSGLNVMHASSCESQCCWRSESCCDLEMSSGASYPKTLCSPKENLKNKKGRFFQY